MSMTGLRVFDDTVHKTNVWLKELMERLDTDNRQDAYRALRVTLWAVRDRIQTDEAVQFAAQFPMLVRGFYFEGWQPGKAKVKDRQAKAFIEHVAEGFDFADVELSNERVIQEVFGLLRSKISRGEIEDVLDCLPPTIAELWKKSIMDFYK